MDINILKVDSELQIKNTAQLAHLIWNQHFTPIIGASQVEYMLKEFQSCDAISCQINDGVNYYIAALNGKNLGYLALIRDQENKKMMISKIYIKQDARNLGIGSAFLKFTVKQCELNNLNKIWLTVNRHNQNSIDWYLNNEFTVIDEVKKDIGNGFFMDDFIMEKIL